MTTDYLHFLIVFDHDHNHQVEEPRVFTSAAAATEAYAEAERLYAERTDQIEVVLLASDSLDTVRITHPIFFGGPIPFTDRLAAALGDA